MRKILYVLAHVLCASVFASLICVGLLDWVGGCGESYIYADGTRHMGECIGRDIFFNFFRRFL
jgi:hypothetical protein